jgi:pSer/pThr/pTyr-binding forkhead associated (FHA) protein
VVFDAEAVGIGTGGAPGAGEAAPAAAVPAEASPTELLPAARPLATVTVRGLDHDVVLRGDRAVAGRLSACDIALTDSNTSREHAAFERNTDDGTWWIRDLGSTNGTILNGTRITSRQQLHDGDLIAIGVTELVFHEPRG